MVSVQSPEINVDVSFHKLKYSKVTGSLGWFKSDVAPEFRLKIVLSKIESKTMTL